MIFRCSLVSDPLLVRFLIIDQCRQIVIAEIKETERMSTGSSFSLISSTNQPWLLLTLNRLIRKKGMSRSNAIFIFLLYSTRCSWSRRFWASCHNQSWYHSSSTWSNGGIELCCLRWWCKYKHLLDSRRARTSKRLFAILLPQMRLWTIADFV